MDTAEGCLSAVKLPPLHMSTHSTAHGHGGEASSGVPLFLTSTSTQPGRKHRPFLTPTLPLSRSHIERRRRRRKLRNSSPLTLSNLPQPPSHLLPPRQPPRRCGEEKKWRQLHGSPINLSLFNFSCKNCAKHLLLPTNCQTPKQLPRIALGSKNTSLL